MRDTVRSGLGTQKPTFERPSVLRQKANVPLTASAGVGKPFRRSRVFYKGLQGVRAHTQFRGFAAAPKHTHTPRRWRALACR